MRISIVQTILHWENPKANLEMFSQKLAPLKNETDLVVLPEMFNTGFSMRTNVLAETMSGPTMEWLAATAKNLDAAIIGSFICEAEDKYYNRLIFMRPDGEFDFYDKKHLFSLASENEHFVPGKKRLTVEWRGWRICPLICYDLRFPAWSRNTTGAFASGWNAYYDVLIFVANWPSRRAHHWRSLLSARAIENQAYVVGVNLVGKDGNELEYTGDSSMIDFSGNALVQIPDGKEGIITQELSLDAMKTYREQLPFLADRDVFEFRI